MTVSELLQKIPASELIEWQAFYELESFGEIKRDYQTALICSTMANTTRSNKADRVYKPEDFMPQYDKKEDSPEELIQKVQFLQSVYSKKR